MPSELAQRKSREAVLRQEIANLKRLLADKVMDLDFFKVALQEVEARRQSNELFGAQASTMQSTAQVQGNLSIEVLDTNVISGIFWQGGPFEILKAWQEQHFRLVISVPILNEYRRVFEEMTKKRPSAVLGPILELIELHSEMVEPVRFAKTVCSDPDDDKFLEAAVAANAGYVVSGDAALLSVKNYQRTQIVRPVQFLKLTIAVIVFGANAGRPSRRVRPVPTTECLNLKAQKPAKNAGSRPTIGTLYPKFCLNQGFTLTT